MSGFTATTVPGSPNDIHPLNVGAKVPRTMVKAPDGSMYDLYRSIDESPTILIFYRGGWCPYCNIHLSQIQGVKSDLNAMGFNLIGVSPDKPEKIHGLVQNQKLGYELYSDSSMRLAQQFGLAYRVPDSEYEHLKKMGIDLEEDSGETHHLLPVPAAYLVEKGSGLITFQYANPDYTVRLNADLLMAAARATLGSGMRITLED